VANIQYKTDNWHIVFILTWQLAVCIHIHFKSIPMKRLLFLLFIYLVNSPHLGAQTSLNPNMKSGEYYLQGVMEVGSGFRFNEDKTFDFFYAYGAMDRMAQGTWEQKGDSLILNNERKPDKDFVLVQSKRTGSKGITIQIKDPNTMVLGHIYCRIKTANGIIEGGSDKNGRIAFDPAAIQAISLIHAYWPDRFSVFEVTDPEHNYFEFTINPKIVAVEFKNLVLRINGNSLLGPHPLIKEEGFTDKECTYVKSN
jgi:hypothetical protein